MVERLLTLVSEPAGPADRASRGEHAGFDELDRVRPLTDVEADEGLPVPAGSTGTVVAIWAGGAAYEVEFTRPVDALATIRPASLERIERAGG